MKKIQLLTLSSITILSILMGGAFTSCSSNVSSSEESQQVISSEVIDGHFDMWTSEQQALMKKYCGEVLPYPVGLVNSDLSVDEYVGIDDSGSEYGYLEISDTSKTFSLKDYYKLTESFGWNTIKSYNGEAKQKNGDTEYYEVTKKASKRTSGYELIYFYANEEKDEEGNVVSEAGNILRCYNDLCSFETADTAYTDDDLEYMSYALTITDLPFIKMGGVNSIGSTDGNTFVVMDYYVEDYSLENAKILMENGFTLDEEESKEYSAYILHKTLSDGATIDAQIYFFQGNNAYFYYTPKYYGGTSWPSELTDEIKTKTGVTVPQFEAEGGKIEGYKKNGVYYIYTFSLSDSFDYELYNEVTLQDPTILWKENISFSCATYTDDDYEPIGFLLIISLDEPTSTFVSSWPTSLISSTIKDTLGIEGVTLPTFEESMLPHKEMDVKYVLNGQEAYEKAYLDYLEYCTLWPEDYGLSEEATDEEIEAKARELALHDMYLGVSVYDQNGDFYDAYAEAFRNLGWYEGYTDENDLYFEDPTGSLCVTFTITSDPNYDYTGKTTVTFSIGSNEAHETEFYFEEESCNVGIGFTKQLSVVKNMLPYDITYSSSDTTGKISVDEDGLVTVAEDAEEGLEATITASINVPGEDEPRIIECVVTCVTLVGYDAETTKNDIEQIIAGTGYAFVETEETNEWDETQYNLDVNLDSASIEEVESFVTSNLIPDGYNVMQEDNEDGELVDSTWSDDIYYIDEENYVDCQSIVYSVDNPFELYIDYGYSLGVLIRYHVYTLESNTHLVVEILNW